MSNGVKVSIITATWNCAETLADCLNSVRIQSYKNREHVVVDGASTDNTLEIIQRHIDQISVFKSEPDCGIYDALNKGIHIATGDVVGFLHSDDVYASSDVLENIAKIFEDPAVCAVYGDLNYVMYGDLNKIFRRWKSTRFSKADLGWGWMPPHPTLYVRREWYSRIGGFDVSYRIAADYLSILKLFSFNDFVSVYLPQVFVNMRLGGASNKSANAILHKSKEDWRALRSVGFGAFSAARAIVWKNFSKLRQFSR